MREFLEPDPHSRTTPRSYYRQFVEPNLHDYLRCADDVRLVFNASLTAFQMRDIVYQFYKRDDPSKLMKWSTLTQFHLYLVGREPLFQTVQSVANVFKHLHAFEASYYEVGSPGALWALKPIGDEVELQSDWEDGPDVFVRRRDGTVASMSTALKAVVDKMWPAVLEEEFSGDD